MKYLRLLTVAVLCLPFWVTRAEAVGQIHAVLVADTDDATIGDGAASNTKRLKQWLTKSGRTLGMRVDINVIQGGDFSCQAISIAVEKLRVGPDDVILLYYSGHGFRTVATATPFPDFYCGAADYTTAAEARHRTLAPADASYCNLSAPDPFCNLAGLAYALAAKGARLTLAFADTCNVLIPPLEEMVPKSAAAAAPNRKDLLTRLLLSSRGALIMSGSIPKQYSWYVPSGGFFTTQLMSAIDAVTTPGASGTGTWSDVVRRATEEILVDPHAEPPTKQQPQASDSVVVAWMPATTGSKAQLQGTR